MKVDKDIAVDRKWKVEYMTLLMREREKYKEGYAEGEIAGEARGEARGQAFGKAHGIIDFALDLGYSKEEILTILQRKLKITEQQADEYVKKFYGKTL